jgi:hypothetical protein
VNHPFGLSEMTEKALGEPSWKIPMLEQAALDRAANEAGRFMNIEFLHQCLNFRSALHGTSP